MVNKSKNLKRDILSVLNSGHYIFFLRKDNLGVSDDQEIFLRIKKNRTKSAINTLENINRKTRSSNNCVFPTNFVGFVNSKVAL